MKRAHVDCVKYVGDAQDVRDVDDVCYVDEICRKKWNIFLKKHLQELLGKNVFPPIFFSVGNFGLGRWVVHWKKTGCIVCIFANCFRLCSIGNSCIPCHIDQV
jgi:hypothetical protein